MITCTRIIEFDAAHRIKDHKSKCKMLHGHRYVLEITFEAHELDKMGMVIDFGDIKERLKTWIEDNWDHTIILFEEDKKLGEEISKFTGQKVFYMKFNPTAENIALYVMHKVCPQVFADLEAKCSKIRLYETPSCYVEVYNSSV